MSCAVGDRVGAIQKADQETVWLFGYGVYEGDLPAPVGPMGLTLDEFEEICGSREYLNPRIALDGGGHVYGLECWWGSEEGVRASIGPRKVVVVPAEERVETRCAKGGAA